MERAGVERIVLGRAGWRGQGWREKGRGGGGRLEAWRHQVEHRFPWSSLDPQRVVVPPAAPPLRTWGSSARQSPRVLALGGGGYMGVMGVGLLVGPPPGHVASPGL